MLRSVRGETHLVNFARSSVAYTAPARSAELGFTSLEMRTPALIIATGLLWSAAAAGSVPKVEEARKLIDDLELEAALKALDAADKLEGNDRATVLEILTLQGIAFGTLGKDAKTRDSFRKLLLLDPEAKLPGDLPPRVRTPFFEAKEWASTNGPVVATPSAELGEGLVRAVKVTMERDVLRLARTARFHLKIDGADQRVEVPFVSGKAVAPIQARVDASKSSLTWWAEILSERRGVLLEVGSAKAPRSESKGVSLTPAAAPPPTVVEGPVSGGWRRPTGFVLVGAGAVAAGIGVALGLGAQDARSKMTGATRDDLGRITSLTQREAAALEAGAHTQAGVANVLFGVGGALAAAGVVLVVMGPSSEPTVALSPTPGGVAVTGSF